MDTIQQVDKQLNAHHNSKFKAKGTADNFCLTAIYVNAALSRLLVKTVKAGHMLQTPDITVYIASGLEYTCLNIESYTLQVL